MHGLPSTGIVGAGPDSLVQAALADTLGEVRGLVGLSAELDATDRARFQAQAARLLHDPSERRSAGMEFLQRMGWREREEQIGSRFVVHPSQGLPRGRAAFVTVSGTGTRAATQAGGLT